MSEQFAAFQTRVAAWMMRCFMRADAFTVSQRAFRFIEEAMELAQAAGVSDDDVRRLVDYVYRRPVGHMHQEIGGVMVTLAGLATADNLKLQDCADLEIERCERNSDAIRAKDLAKPQSSPLPGALKTPKD